MVVVDHLLEEIDRCLADGGAFIQRVGFFPNDHAGRALQPDLLELAAELLVAGHVGAEGGDFDAVESPGFDLFEQRVVSLADVRAPEQQVDSVFHAQQNARSAGLDQGETRGALMRNESRGTSSVGFGSFTLSWVVDSSGDVFPGRLDRVDESDAEGDAGWGLSAAAACCR